jgi:DNA-binding XRE family transcriptional regulator
MKNGELAEYRRNKGVTQSIASKAIGISQHYLSTIETGKRGNRISSYLAKRIADYYGFNWTRFYE